MPWALLPGRGPTQGCTLGCDTTPYRVKGIQKGNQDILHGLAATQEGSRRALCPADGKKRPSEGLGEGSRLSLTSRLVVTVVTVVTRSRKWDGVLCLGRL